MKNNSNHILLNEVFTATRDGRRFFDYAASQIDNAELKILFSRIALVKSEIMTDLASELIGILSEGSLRASPEMKWSSEFSSTYENIRPLIGSREFENWGPLVDSEARFLAIMEKTLLDKKISVNTRAVLTKYTPEIRTCSELLKKHHFIPMRKVA